MQENLHLPSKQMLLTAIHGVVADSLNGIRNEAVSAPQHQEGSHYYMDLPETFNWKRFQTHLDRFIKITSCVDYNPDKKAVTMNAVSRRLEIDLDGFLIEPKSKVQIAGIKSTRLLPDSGLQH